MYFLAAVINKLADNLRNTRLNIKILIGDKEPGHKVIFEADSPIVAIRERIN